MKAPHRAGEAAVRFLALLLAPLSSLVAFGTAPYVSFDSYLIVLRHVGLLVFPWVAVWAALSGRYKIAAVAFVFTTVGWAPLTDGWWVVVLVGTLLVLGCVALDATQSGPSGIK